MRIVSGIQPSGQLHIGNYFGAVKQWVDLQKDNQCFFFIADLHAMTVPYDTIHYQKNILTLTAELLASGVDPKHCTLFVQSRVPEHLKLAWALATITPIGELERMTQYKEKSAQKQTANAGLFTYPILQASDILLYHPQGVPVGEDQVQHIELARKLARKFNARYGTDLPEPKPLINRAKRLMALNNPLKKMSKSVPGSFISLADSDEEITRKINQAVTDSTPNPNSMSPGVANLFTLARAVLTNQSVEKLQNEYKNKTLRYANLKAQLAQATIKIISPIRQKREKLLADPNFLKKILNEGNENARQVAGKVWTEIAKRLGLE